MSSNISVKVIGIGPGDPTFIYPHYLDMIKQADILIGGKRQIELIHSHLKEDKSIYIIDKNFSNLLDHVFTNCIDNKKIVIIASGDPTFFGIMKTIKKLYPDLVLQVYPNLSSAQWALSKIGWSWEDVYWLSIHGRDLDSELQKLPTYGKIGMLLEPRVSPARLAIKLSQYGWDKAKFILARNLTMPDESITSLTFSELCGLDSFTNDILLADLCILPKKTWPYLTAGIPEDQFITGNVPITKTEARALVNTKLRLKPRLVIWEIGTGTGSISIETSLTVPDSEIYTADPRQESAELLKANMNRFGCRNIKFFQGKAPEICLNWPEPDRVIIGGHGGNLNEILEFTHNKLRSDGRFVIIATQLKTADIAWTFLMQKGYQEIEGVQIQTNRFKLGPNRTQLWDPQNPVFIISGSKKLECD